MPGSPPALALQVGNSFAEVARAIEQTVGRLRDEGASKHALFVAELALEELLTNVVKYAGSSGASAGLELRLPDDRVELRITDHGHPFDPWSRVPAAAPKVHPRPLGGQGLMLVKKFCERTDYARDGACNVVTVVFPRQGEA